MDFNDYIPAFLSGNQYFSAGFGLVGVGTALTLLQRTSRAGILAVKNKLSATLEITSTDPAYPWVLSWLTRKGIKTRQLSVQTLQRVGHDGICASQFVLVPSTGRHWFFYDGFPILIKRNRDKMIDANRSTPFESISFTTFSRSVFDKILEEAYQFSVTQSSGYTIIYKAYNYEWRPIGHPKKIRPLDSVILAPGLSNHLVNDFKRFINSQNWYHSVGIPHRRCYLLYGPPGCGKTSFVAAIAGHFNYNICTLNISDGLLCDDRLFHLLSVMPIKTILLLEDIDGGIVAEGKTGVTYAGLLNALDGVVSTEERLIFMTTNHLEKLPKALIRPGRVDVMVSISYPNDQQVKDLVCLTFK